jgi:type IV pilus assembly protein PilQ
MNYFLLCLLFFSNLLFGQPMTKRVDVFKPSEWHQKKQAIHWSNPDTKTLSLTFKAVDVRDVLQQLADFVGINLVMNERVSGNMSLCLHDIAWEQALDIILATQGLDKKQSGQVLLIDSVQAMAERKQAILDERLAAQKRTPLFSQLLQIKYANAVDLAKMITDKTNSLLSERGVLRVDSRTNTLWLQDAHDKIQEIQALIQQVDIPVKQVLIEARIVNMTKDCATDLGVRWGISNSTHLSGTLEGAIKQAAGMTPGNVPISERLNLDLGATPFDATPASVGIALAKLGDNVLLDLELSALESEGRAEIVASPRLMTVNQRPAVIESGEDIPYQESTLGGATAVAFKKAVLSLKVVPHITPDGTLLMDLVIHQDSDSGQRVQGVPVLLTKSIETNVLVKNGQTLVLGGIYKKDRHHAVVRVPFLGRLPGVGFLFRRKQVRKRNEELLIFITPKIIVGREG